VAVQERWRVVLGDLMLAQRHHFRLLLSVRVRVRVMW
jgi:hypothetical protein